MILTRVELTKLGGVGVGQALQEVLHLGLAHVVQVDQGIEAVELLEPLLGPLRDIAGLTLLSGWRERRTVSRTSTLTRAVSSLGWLSCCFTWYSGERSR